MRVISVDVGKKGYLATWEGEELVETTPMPLEGKEIDWKGVFDVIAGANKVVLERQFVNKSTAEQFGGLTAIATVCGCEVVAVHPREWLAWFSLSGDKAAHIQMAELLGYPVPRTSSHGNAKKSPDAADSILIGHYYLAICD